MLVVVEMFILTFIFHVIAIFYFGNFYFPLNLQFHLQL